MFRFFKDRRAIEMAEAAMTFPIAILVMLAMTNLGLVVFGQQSVQAAARHGALHAHPPAPDSRRRLVQPVWDRLRRLARLPVLGR